MRKILSLALFSCLATLGVPPAQAALDAQRTAKDVKFANGTSSATIKGRIKGNQSVDYRLEAGAGQRMKLTLQAGNPSANFNLLPPDSQDVAMYIGDAGGIRFEGLLPDDGAYTVRVFLTRAAARRGASSDYTLSVSVSGEPLKPLAARADALVAGTRFHARGTVKCVPQYTQTRECEASVVRRGTDGSATLELRWDKGGTRRILFAAGKPVATDTPQPFTFTRNERGWTVVFAGEESFEIPEPLVVGG